MRIRADQGRMERAERQGVSAWSRVTHCQCEGRPMHARRSRPAWKRTNEVGESERKRRQPRPSRAVQARPALSTTGRAEPKLRSLHRVWVKRNDCRSSGPVCTGVPRGSPGPETRGGGTGGRPGRVRRKRGSLALADPLAWKSGRTRPKWGWGWGRFEGTTGVGQRRETEGRVTPTSLRELDRRAAASGERRHGPGSRRTTSPPALPKTRHSKGLRCISSP